MKNNKKGLFFQSCIVMWVLLYTLQYHVGAYNITGTYADVLKFISLIGSVVFLMLSNISYSRVIDRIQDLEEQVNKTKNIEDLKNGGDE